MIKKSTMIMLTFLVIVVVVSGCTDNKNNTTNSQNISSQTHNNSNNITNNTSNTTNKIISAAEAKSIALKYVEESDVTAGTPILNTVDGRQIYVVPLYQNGEAVGEIEIDAVTGENLGGAGGAP